MSSACRQQCPVSVTRRKPPPRPRTAAKTKEKIQDFRKGLFDRPSYSSDLASSDYFLFLHLKQWIGGQSCENDEELKNAVVN